jgi:hypothetical protein
MQKTQTLTPKILFGISVFAFVLMLVFVKPIMQDLDYHNFADKQYLFAVNNFLNVVSNIGFIIIGMYGFYIIRKFKVNLHFNAALFGGIILTGIGSAYYHYNPNNTTLVWDRLPMTIVFTSFFAQLYTWYFSYKTGIAIWIGSLIIGIFSVFYWQYTETIHEGDLRIYAVVQFLPMLLILIILALHGKQHKFLYRPLSLVLISYVIAKLLEHYDFEILHFTGLIGGHPLKHIAAAVATFYIVVMVKEFEVNKRIK